MSESPILLLVGLVSITTSAVVSGYLVVLLWCEAREARRSRFRHVRY